MKRLLYTLVLGITLSLHSVARGSPIVISEFMAINDSTLQDEDGNYSDWIELHNPTDHPIELKGWYLTDDADQLTRWQFPQQPIGPGEYLLVFASDKDRATSGKMLHTNFKLSGSGEFLALVKPDGKTIAFSHAPKFPKQQADQSFGIDQPLAKPTPGTKNAAGTSPTVADTKFSIDRGFLNHPFITEVTTATPDATIVYTLDGSAPTLGNGTQAPSPVQVSINRTTILRAAAFKTGHAPSNTDTMTYLFPADVIGQDFKETLARGFPASWQAVAPDYGMDPRIPADQVRAALKALPAISIVMKFDDLFGEKGIYAHPEEEGGEWERPCSVEWIRPHDKKGFQIDCGIRIQGGYFREFEPTKKKSFRLLFKNKYGAGKLIATLFEEGAVESFDTITLRMESHDGWQNEGRPALYARDQFSRDLQRALGQPSAHGTRAHLFLNGVYWGVYNPVERPDNRFGASYIGGKKEEWDSINGGQPINARGDAAKGQRALTAWKEMVRLCREVDRAYREEDRTAAYYRVQGKNPDGSDNPNWPSYLDADSLIDYMLVNIYGGTADWPLINYYAGRWNHPDTKGWQFFIWDAERTHLLTVDLNRNVIGAKGGVAEPFQHLRASKVFRRRFAKRAEWALGPDGPMNPKAAAGRFAALTEPLILPLVAESARWGDQHYKDEPRTVEEHWKPHRDFLLADYFPKRTDIVVDQLKAADLFPRTGITDTWVSDRTTNSATLTASLNATGTTFHVSVFRGDQKAYLGQFEGATNLSHEISLTGKPVTFHFEATNLSERTASKASAPVYPLPALPVLTNGLRARLFNFTYGVKNFRPIETLLKRKEDDRALQVTPMDISDFKTVFPKIRSQDIFTVIWEGFIFPKEADFYTFGLDCDDGGMVAIDLDHSGVFEREETLLSRDRRGSDLASVTLLDRPYRIVIAYFDMGGPNTLTVKWRRGKWYKLDELECIDGKSGIFVTPAAP